MAKLEETTIRDFGGGWNVSDSDKSLSSRYQPVSDNVVRGTDGHFRVRYGYKRFAGLRKGVETVVAPSSWSVETLNGSSVVTITKPSHGYVDGQHISITDFESDINGITREMMNRVHGIVVDNVDEFSIYVRGVADATGSDTRVFGWTHDTHVMSARDIFGRYYKNNLIVFSENGEIAAVNAQGEATLIWSYKHAKALTLEPWTYCRRVSAEIIRGRLIAVNGAQNDKPIAIDGTTVNYLVDASTLSNEAIPRAEFVIAASQYVILVNTEYGPTMLEIGARNTVMTCSREVDPSDAVELDIGMLTQTIDNTILGASVIRSRVFIGFADRTQLGTLGIYNNDLHEPDFNDNIAEFGTFSHSSIVSLGNDLFCAGINGINSLEISKASGEFAPSTVSDLIHPVMLRHFGRLSEDDRRYRVFALFDNTTRSYMLFAPKYSEGEIDMMSDPLYATTTLQPYGLMYLRWPNHVVDEGDYVDVSGVIGYNSQLHAALVNGRRKVRHVLDRDTIVIETDAYPSGMNVQFGGSNVKIEPVNDETVGYIFEYNPRLKIRRWTRFRNMNFDWGARSQLNTLFFGRDGTIWQYGDNNNPFSADRIGEYDYSVYSNSFDYNEGDRVLDSDGTVYRCAIAHTSAASGSFFDARTADGSLWAEYLGDEIEWALDTAWTDFKARKENKEVELVSFDTKGSAAFTLSIFTNSHYRNLESLALDPIRSTEFVGQDAAGFGGGEQPFGGGRNTRQEWLHSMPATGKLFRFRFAGSSIHPLQVNAVTFYYKKSRGVLT